MANSTAAVSEFKAHLSEYLRHVQNGDEITILDHKRPIAKVIPIKAKRETHKLRIIPAKTKKLVDIRANVKLRKDPAAYIREDRDAE